MLDFKPLPLATVSPGTAALLQKGYYVKFSDEWPATLSHVVYQSQSENKTRGKFFQVRDVNPVPQDLHYILPTGDWRWVDFSNTLSNFNENLYPQNPHTLYEIQIGFKPGNYIAHFAIPAGEYMSRLEQATMIPNVTVPVLRYLGAKKPEDSPYDDKRIFFYCVFNMEPLLMQLYVDAGVLFEKCVVGLVINKCYLTQIENPTPDMVSRAKTLPYYTSLRW